MKNSNSKKRVYFLGAGASKASDFELPTMSEFFTKETFKDGEYPALHKFIEKVFPNVNITKLNLEDVITRLELSMDKFGAFGEHPETYFYDARREFSLYVHKRLTYQPKNGRLWCEKHKDLFDQLNDQDSIITLNYDLIVDYTLHEISPKDDGILRNGCLLKRMYDLIGKPLIISEAGEPPSLLHKETGLGYYLKLHGSIDWLYCANSTCGNHQHFFPNVIGLEGAHYFPGNLCRNCGSPLVSVIIPPTMNKTFDEYPKLGLLWSLAFRKIKEADELVLIGMALPDSDYYLKWLLNSATSSRINIKVVAVNPDKAVCDKIEKLTGVSPEYWNDFCGYVDNLKKA
ncbi:MAG TPA: hypothetical protein ACFYD6_00650 [Candidatus Brocadiia bacterium]|nr:hypothetical protein [Candidatus Brocadiales bacterium]